MFLALSLLAPWAHPLKAQWTRPAVSLEGSWAFASLYDDDFQFVESGTGHEVQARLGYAVWSLAAGYLRTEHELSSLIAEPGDGVTLTTFFLEPRLTFPAEGRFRPFVLLRLGRIVQDVRLDYVDLGPTRLEATGMAYGGGLGVHGAMTSRVSVTVSAAYSRLHFGELRVIGQDLEAPESAGSSIILRAGATLRLLPWHHGQQPPSMSGPSG